MKFLLIKVVRKASFGISETKIRLGRHRRIKHDIIKIKPVEIYMKVWICLAYMTAFYQYKVNAENKVEIPQNVGSFPKA
jgi:hypothetical protein